MFQQAHRGVAARRHPPARRALAALLCIAPVSAWCDGDHSLERIVVSTSATDQVGVADAASAGTVTQQQLAARAVYRPGELLESTPGLIVSQHSGEGKANQFYLRGFNLDHGTDLRTSVDGMTVNQRSHAHGQGWSDLNFVIAELAAGLDYRKGTYAAADGDFSSAGSVHIRYLDKLPQGVARLSMGQTGYRRALLANAPDFARGHLLYALESTHNDGPFTRPDDFRKLNALLRYSEGDNANGLQMTAMAYRGRWHSTDQIPRRALADGRLPSRFDAVDDSDGGRASRYSLSGGWQQTDGDSATRINAWLAATRLDLFSNFTYFLADPVNGDQFAQPDRRVTFGLNASRQGRATLWGRAAENTVGLQLQGDNIFNGLLATRARQTLAAVRRDHIVEQSIGVYAENTLQWSDRFRSVAGLRGDYFRARVGSSLAANSGERRAHLFSPKLGLIFGPWRTTEAYVNLGSGFHSNDARGATNTVDPASGAATTPSPLLVRSRGAELGLRTSLRPGWQTSIALYRLDFASELVFAGDAGTTEASRTSRRDGIELVNSARLNAWLTLDTAVAFARARFRGDDPAGNPAGNPTGNRIPGAVEGVAAASLTVDRADGFSGSLQWRYLGPRPLIEDNRVRSSSTAQFNGRIGYRWRPDIRITLEGFNLANRKTSAIDYYYASRLPGEPAAGIGDVHSHPLEPRSIRLTLGLGFR